MKRLLFTLTFLAVLVLPMLAQASDDAYLSDLIPIVKARIEKDQVPPAIVKAVNIRFDKANPLTWSRVPFELKDFGWVYDINSSEIKPANYEVMMKTTGKSDLMAIYGENGDLQQTTQLSRNVPIPRYIQEAIATGEYKDWTVTSDREFIKFYRGKGNIAADQHFRVTLMKDNKRKNLAFNYEARTDKYGELTLVRK